jgi:phosphoenolpyruvate-protein phosphotransferase
VSVPRHLTGVGAAPGIAIAPAWRYTEEAAAGISTTTAPAGAATAGAATETAAAPVHPDPGAAVRAAAEAAAVELEALANRVRATGREEEAGIFDGQALLALSPSLVDEAAALASAGSSPAEAVRAAAEAAAETLAALGDELLAARAADVRDVGARIARILRGERLALPEAPSIAVAEDLPPSVTAEIPPGLLQGIVLEGGSPTAHACILARSLGIPAVVGTRGLLAAVDEALAAQPAEPGQPLEVAVDGQTGAVVLGPDATIRREFQERAGELAARRARAAASRGRAGATADGRRVLLFANIGTPDDAPRALEARAEGVGLFRTEFLFMKRQVPPTEDEQVAAYRRVFEAFGPARPVVVRLADIGGDKGIPYLGLPPEANPFLGVRAIRLAYDEPELLRTQLRAIWRAGGLAGVVPHVMAPMVATLEDVALLEALRDEARATVTAAGQPCAEAMTTGIMVEIPAAALLAAELARRVDFFSIGTNDLTQYLMAADRGTAALARFHDALHPAVLRAVAAVVAGADAAGIPVAVCGEIAGDPAGALVLVGLGVDELSADAGSLDEVRSALAACTAGELETLARGALDAPDAAAVRRAVEPLLARVTGAPEAPGREA